ncbi:mechanosensitive ion channel family protein [Brackiella oedipodis]|uniref:mechanosensitive ion channel family protein n=1 Tax=Brackiella oedipodis TaxID=124225 RepID=UPI000686179A|nr:mechanosensitive ion channel domain-containing protein [Brackiella oedipodis]
MKNVVEANLDKQGDILQDFILDIMSSLGLGHSTTIANTIILILVFAASYALYYLLILFGISWIRKGLRSSKKALLFELGQREVLRYMVMVAIMVTMQMMVKSWMLPSPGRDAIMACLKVVGLIFTGLTINEFVTLIAHLAARHKKFQKFPIRGIEQTIKLVVAIAIALLIISVLIGKSPLILLSGLGAMTAVLMLVFKDPLMGLVSGIQLSANDMLAVDDWLTMPSIGVDGTVLDIGLTTVKVENFDNSFSYVPTSFLISTAFVNMRGMSQSGGRRISRAINIDMNSVRFLKEEDIAEFKHSHLLEQYLDHKTKEIKQFNESRRSDLSYNFNGRRLTNLGTFRAYVLQYLKSHPSVNKGMSIMVRLMDPTPNGIPLQVYCFTNTTVWAEYEAIQSDIFDHLLAVLPMFDLSIYQNLGGKDVSQALIKGLQNQSAAQGMSAANIIQ